MVNFGEDLLVSQYVPWALYYIDYLYLKKVLEEEYKQGDDNKSHGSSWSGRQSGGGAVSSQFLSLLYVQTEKVTFFVLQEQGRITMSLDECRQELLKGVNLVDTSQLVLLEEKYVEIGIAVLRLIRFVDLNVTGFRKILKKHDKLARSRLSLSYLAFRGHADISSGMGYQHLSRSVVVGEELNLILLGNQLLQPLLHDNTFTALAGALEAGTEELKRSWVQYELNHAPATGEVTKRNTRNQTSPNLQRMAGGVDLRATCSNSHAYRASGGDLLSMMDEHDAMEARRRTTVRPGQILLQIHAARGRLRNTNDFVKLLAAQMMVAISDDGSLEGDETESKTGTMKRTSSISNTLNLLSTFLYMANYYIVAPTSASYADKLGADSSIASIIIGMTSVAALVSTVLYSWWTSYSYKSALIFASACSVIGNLLYALGLPCQSLTIVMLGRLLNGFGSARSINRRYVADSYSQADRTAASAAFVTATALGMATGPALASVLHVATEESTSVYWQAENAPGAFMFFVWSIFLLCLIFKFEEPPRKLPLATRNNKLQQGTSAEKKSLLAQPIPEALDEVEEVSLCCNVPVIITLVVYMILKMVLEAVLSSEGNLTKLYFGWTSNLMGVHLTIIALLILPVNFAVSFLARRYHDRELIIGLLVGMFFGCLIILQYQHDIRDYTLYQYLIGSALLFVCASALEAPNMSLLSKVIPRKWSRGIVNVGLLATESGTFGRVVGDVLLAAVGSRGMEELLNRAFSWYAAIILGTLLVTCAAYDQLVEPLEKDS